MLCFGITLYWVYNLSENKSSTKSNQMAFIDMLTVGINVFFFSAKMFKGGKENERAANMFFGQQDKNKDGHLDRVSFSLATVTESIRMQ